MRLLEASRTSLRMHRMPRADGTTCCCFIAASLLLVVFLLNFGDSSHRARQQGGKGSCAAEAQASLKWGADRQVANHICCHNRQFAEFSGYWESTFFPSALPAGTQDLTVYDSVTGDALFIVPRGRSYATFIAESRRHGWPSFRDAEVVTENVRVLRDGEAVSVNGTHLGHNIPDIRGNRYCINLVCIAGVPRS